MKKILLISVAAAAMLLAPVEAYSFGWGKIGIKGCWRTAELSSGAESGVVSGGGGGVALNLNLPVPGMSLQPEVNLLYKYDRMMAEVPLNFQAGLDLVLVRPFICVTPYIDLPLSNGGEGSVNMFQAGFGVGGGVDLWKFQIQCRYNWNITDFYSDSSEKLRGLDLSLIFFF